MFTAVQAAQKVKQCEMHMKAPFTAVQAAQKNTQRQTGTTCSVYWLVAAFFKIN